MPNKNKLCRDAYKRLLQALLKKKLTGLNLQSYLQELKTFKK